VRERGGRALAVPTDVTETEQLEALVVRTMDEFGRIDVLVNNSGTVWGAAPEDMPLEGWQKVVDVNLTGTFLFSQAAGRAMIEQGGGKIVNIASVLALTGTRPEIMNAIAYNATKGGILSFTRDLACKWAQHGIMVNAIAPGWFPSDMSNVVLEKHEAEMRESIPLRRFGGPDDLKGAVAFLASAASDYVTGQTLVVDGGQSVW
jgi:gluconate 5-dehydrogenase